MPRGASSGRRRRHRVDADRRLLALELVDRPDPRLGRQQPLDRPDLGVVRRDDQDVVPADRPASTPCSVDPGRAALDERPGERGDRVGLVRRLVVRAVGRRRRAAAGRRRRRASTGDSESLADEVRLGLEPVVVEDLGGEGAQVRVEPPGRLEEQAAVGRHRRVRRRGRGRAPTGRRPAGGVPCSGWSSCCGSPSRTRLSRRPATSRRRSRARSGRPRRRTGRRPRRPSSRDAQSQDVPAARFARPSSSRAATSLGVLAPGSPRSSSRTCVLRRRCWIGADVDAAPASAAARGPRGAGCRSPCGSSR